MVVSKHFVSRVTIKCDDPDAVKQFPLSLPALTGLDYLEFHPKVTFLVGENGSGKSTLLEALAIALEFNPEGGSRNFKFNTRASHSNLHEYLRIARGIRKPRDGFFFRAESFFNVATEIENLDNEPSFGPPIISYFGGKSLHEQSHGESFLAMLMNRFRGDGLYLLDEPEAALSPQRQLAALTRLHDLSSDGAQFIIATHSPILMAYPDAWIYQFSDSGIERVAYEDTEHFQVTASFMKDHERMLHHLLSPDESDDRDE